MGHWGTSPLHVQQFHFSSLWSKCDSQLCEISWCRSQQLTALSIITTSIIKLLVIKHLLHPALKLAVSAPWHNFKLCPNCPSLQQILATQLTFSAHPTKVMRGQFVANLSVCLSDAWMVTKRNNHSVNILTPYKTERCSWFHEAKFCGHNEFSGSPQTNVLNTPTRSRQKHNFNQ